MADHEGHFLRGDVLGGDDEVAFIFAGGGVKDDDEVAGGEGGDAGRYGVEICGFELGRHPGCGRNVVHANFVSEAGWALEKQKARNVLSWRLFEGIEDQLGRRMGSMEWP